MRFVFGKHGDSHALQLPMGLPHVLARVVDSDGDTDNRTCAMNCLSNIAIHCRSLVLVDNSIVACALRVVQEQGTGADPIPSSLFNLPPLLSHPTTCIYYQLNRNRLPIFCYPQFRYVGMVHERKVWMLTDEQSRWFLAVCIRLCLWRSHSATHTCAHCTPARLISARRRAPHCQPGTDVSYQRHGQPGNTRARPGLAHHAHSSGCFGRR